MLKFDSPANFFIFYAANFFFAASYYLIFPIIPNYAHSLKAGVLGIFPITMTFFLAIIISAPLAGYYIDWKGRLRFAIGGALASALIIFVYTLVDSIALLLLLRLLHGAAVAVFSVAMFTMLTDATENAWRGEIISSFLLPQIFWIAIGPSFALFIFPYGGAKTVFVTAAISGLLAVIFTSFVKSPKLLDLGKRKVKIAEYLLFDNMLILAAVFVFNAVYSALLLNVETYATTLQGENSIGFYAWFVLAGLLVMYNTGNLSDHIGRGYTVLLGFLFLLISTVMVLFSGDKSIVTIAGIFFGVAYGLILPALVVWWMDVVSVETRGTSMGVFHAIQSLGMIVGLWVLNIFNLIGPKGAFGASLLFIIIMLAALAYRQWLEIKEKRI